MNYVTTKLELAGHPIASELTLFEGKKIPRFPPNQPALLPRRAELQQAPERTQEKSTNILRSLSFLPGAFNNAAPKARNERGNKAELVKPGRRSFLVK